MDSEGIYPDLAEEACAAGAAVESRSPDLGVAEAPTPPQWLGGALYSADGLNYAPPYPAGAIVGYADGYGNNFLIHSLSQILHGPLNAKQSHALRDKCVSVRATLVNKYECIPHAELELADLWHLIIEELGGSPREWNVICWAGYRCEEVECAGGGARCARLRHSAGPPGHFEPLWIPGDFPQSGSLRVLNEGSGNDIEVGEVPPDAIVGICSDREHPAAHQQEAGKPRETIAPKSRPRNLRRPRKKFGPKSRR